MKINKRSFALCKSRLKQSYQTNLLLRQVKGKYNLLHSYISGILLGKSSRPARLGVAANLSVSKVLQRTFKYIQLKIRRSRDSIGNKVLLIKILHFGNNNLTMMTLQLRQLCTFALSINYPNSPLELLELHFINELYL